MKNIAAEIADARQMAPVLEGLERTTRSQLVYGLDESARNLAIAGLYLKTERPFLIVAADALHANKIYEDLLAVLGENEVWLFPGKELLYYGNIFSESGDTSAERIAVMEQLAAGKKAVVVTTVSGLLAKMCPHTVWRENCFFLHLDDEMPIDKLLRSLSAIGYERVEMVEKAGQMSVRGGIADIFPVGRSFPYRIEFFGDTIDSIRTFDPETQRSREHVESLFIAPAREVVVGNKEQEYALKQLAEEQERLQKQAGNNKERLKKATEKLAELKEKIHEEIYFPGLEQCLLYFYPRPDSLLDWFSEDAVLILCDPLRCEQAAEQLEHELSEIQSTLFAQGELLAGQIGLTWPYVELLAGAKQQMIAFSLFAQQGKIIPYRRTTAFAAKPVPRFLGQWELLAQEISQWQKQGYRVAILTSTRQRSSSISEILADKNVHAYYSLAAPQLSTKAVTILHGVLESGFVLPEIKLAMLTEQDILPQRKKRSRIKSKEGIRVGDYQELQVGDYVVHEQHGIGQYLGLRTLEVGGISRDYLYIQYAGNDKLYLPIEQIDAVRKYIGVEGKKPKISSLGGGEWNRIKARVQASVQELAKELLELYASRETEPGHAFTEEHPWERDFAASFPYEETPDQLQAIKEIMDDLAKSRPMDRLLCGDVGYGKTEVALRAAFKVIMAGFQAAFLVPTTVLAQQHYRTFLERLEGFPVTVGILSRFQSKAEQKATLQGLKDGTLDLVVGTHRLLSKDVSFHNLGLLVIDEEQRFGVRHKERIKMLKKNVDVLTMTATPIPRTLHMSLAGVRDMSVIETPPEDRYPVQTYVLEYSDALVREAILREVARQGQVYFVHNRVQSIDRWAVHLQELVPEVKIAVAHGQMPAQKLEQVMLDFLNGEYDVLLSTTIVEAGLDIPNVNTIIINDADKFGLAQLYQLRGRVGRSNRIAYCYLTYQKDKVITEVAEKRLQAIKEFTELGSGFKIALRDLEIRGAGNILGPEQHGFMMAVGFDMYMKLLEDAVHTLQGTKKEKKLPPRIEIQADAYLPTGYISDARQKIVFYQRIAAVTTLQEVEDIREELIDRYGALPGAAENLLNVARIRLLAEEIGVTAVSEEKGEIMIRFAGGAESPSGDTLLIVSKLRKGRLTAGKSKQFVLAFRKNFSVSGEKLQFLLTLFTDLKQRLAKEKT